MVPAVERAMAVMGLLAGQREPMSVTRLATQLELPKSSVHGLCNTLARLGYLRRRDDGGYLIGPGVMGLASAFVEQTDVVQEFAALWSQIGSEPEETIILSVLEGADVIYLAVRHGERPLGLAFRIGLRLPAHLAATGKAMLAYLGEGVVRRLYPHARMPAYRGHPGTSVKSFLDDMAEVRERGWSMDDEGVREGVFCLGAPVFDASMQPVAGVGACSQKASLDAGTQERHRNTVIEVAQALTRRLGGMAPPVSTAAAGRSVSA
jgi:DNA-binding IclR family transcriptional regulator